MDIYQAFMNFVNKSNLPMYKLICIKHGALSKRGKNNGFIAL